MDNREPNDDMRQRIFDEVLYEIEMFISLPMDSPQSVLHNALAEAFLLHGRVLTEFFQTTKRRDDQVLCSDFGFSPSAIDPMNEIEARHRKALAHLTYARLNMSGTSKSWLYKTYAPKIRKRILEFLYHMLKAKPIPLSEEQTGRCVAVVQKLVE
jgi:hypothetical protein